MAKVIALTKGQETIVDDCDFEDLSRFKWQTQRMERDGTLYGFYAVRDYGGRLNRKTEYMHRRITGAPPGAEVDHIDGNRLNNVRANLRLATPAENRQNRGKYRNNTSGFHGVCWHGTRRKWRAYVSLGGKQFHAGLYDRLEDAARARDAKAKELYGEFARLNFET